MTRDQGGAFQVPPAESLIAAHARLIAEFGGSEGIRDAGALDAALARPFNLIAYGGDQIPVPALAVAVAYSIARIRHPFADGNKRVAFAALVGILAMNGLVLDATESDATEVMTKVAAGEMSENDLVTWVEGHAFAA